MGVILDLIPIEADRIEQLRKDIKVYYSLQEEKSVWIRILRESRTSPIREINEKRIRDLLSSYNDLNLSYTLGKDWDVLHYLICGSMEEVENEPLSRVVLGGEKLYNDKNWYYSPPLLLSIKETKAVATDLSKVSEGEIKKRYNPEIIADLCFEISSDKNDLSFHQIVSHLQEKGHKRYWKIIKELASYYFLASEQSMGMIKSWS